MRARVTALVAVVALLAAAGAGAGAWLLAGNGGPQYPEISVYSHGQLARVGPYQYCDVLDLHDCQTPGTLGELVLRSGDPVQLSVPSAIGRAPWLLSLWYEDPADTTTTLFRPGSRLAVTIPAVDAARGRLTGITVQLLTLVRLPHDELGAATHADWSVRMLP